MPPTLPIGKLVGRDRPIERLSRAVEQVAGGQSVVVLVAGEAGIGKTALLGVAAANATERGVQVVWGTCLDGAGAPGYWPWTQALDHLVRERGPDAVREAVGEDAALLASIVPSLSHERGSETSERDRLLAMDATTRLLTTLATDEPILIVLDDLQWADDSSLALLEFVARAPSTAGIGLIGAYRHDELSASTRQRIAELATFAEHVRVEGLDAGAVHGLITALTGDDVDATVAEEIHRRTGGHPFFVRELALLGHHAGTAEEQVPVAVNDAIARRIDRLPPDTIQVLEATSVVGTELLPDVVAAALDRSVVEVDAAARAAIEAGVLARSDSGPRFAHDLLRETVLARVQPAQAIDLHRTIGDALEKRGERGGDVTPAELARHFTAAIPVDGPDRALQWSLAAADDDCDALAFTEAAGHLRRLRAALTEASIDLDDARLIDVLVAEADALARACSIVDSRGLLRLASDVAERAADPVGIARVALAITHLGATFATRRDEIVHDLERALTAVQGVDDVWEARVSATLARELQHSVPEDRPRAGPLSEQALELGRRSKDPSTLLTCLFARHDLLWTPGGAAERAEVAGEIVVVARASGDQERHADGLLLLANARLELGSPAFEAPLESCLALLDSHGQLRHRYTAQTRRACLALLRGRLDEAERLIEQAADLGERLHEPDTGNVRMSQQLELVRARADADELRRFAGEAVDHWTGAPVHAHGVAAGFLTRAGDVDAAAHHVATVVDLGTWRADRSYLWSVLVRELAQAAIALDDRELCRQLFDDLSPIADSCGVNGAVVAFAGSHAHTAGLLAAALGRSEASQLLLDQAATTYRRLGATGWLADARADAARSTDATSTASMRRAGDVWHLGFAGKDATVPHAKGLADIARLVSAAGSEVHVLELVDAVDRSGGSGEMADRSALDAYRRRLADLEAEIDDATLDNDPERRARAEVERQALVDELGRVSGMRRQPREFANHPAERARKAVAGRIRDAIRKLEPVLPELAAHLQRTIVTGNYCRYRPDATQWDIDTGRVTRS